VFAGRGATEDAAKLASSVPETFIFNLPAMTVNLNDDGAEGDQFLKLTIALEVADEAVMKEIQPRMAKVVDAFQVYLRELRKSDLEGSAGIYRLKEELRRRVNLAIFPAHVEGILFKEILVQ
jgi:flagellar FliL protein